jgi:hypothetical protein
LKNTGFFAGFLLIFFIFGGCNLQDKQQAGDNETTVNKQVIVTDSDKKLDEKLPTSMTSGINEDRTVSKTQTVSNQQSDLTFNTQDKRMIIRSGTMSIEIDKFEDAEGKIKQIVSANGGYVTNSSSQLNASGKKQGSITIRVAADKFDKVLDELAEVGKVMNQNITGKDVTEEYMDAEARLKTQRELESRLLKLLTEKTAKLTDIVDVETKLASVREQIEKTEGRMRFLKDQAAYSTLTVSLYEPAILQTSSGGGFFYELERGLKKGLTGFTSVLSGIITFIIAFSPILVVLLVILYFVRRYLRKRKQAKA